MEGLTMLLTSLVLAAAAAATPAVIPPHAKQLAEGVTDSAIEGPTRFLANDLLEGRAPGTPGEVIARAYLASSLELLGLKPGAPGGSWQQHFEFVGLKTEAPPTWTFAAREGAVTLDSWKDFIAATGVQTPTADIDGAELVFVGYGIVAPEYGWDDYKGADLKGKVLVMLNNDPDWEASLFAGKRRLYYGRWTYKYEEAARQGAAGAIIIHTTPSAGYRWQVVQTSWTGTQYELPAAGEPTIQIKAWTTEAATRRLLAAAGLDLDELTTKAHSRNFKPVPLGITTSIHLRNEVSHVDTGNVIGLLPGSDPALASQVVVFSAHEDHLGVGKPDDTGDRIYNGARDNASGVGMVMAIARAFTHMKTPPRRSVMFLFVTGEESGLLGSAYFAAHPPVPVDSIVADINFDAGNIFGRTRDVAQVGRGKSTLDAVLDAAAALQGRTVTDEAHPDRGMFYRSDQLSMVNIGIPALYFSSGTNYIGRPPEWGHQVQDAWLAQHYHQPSDEVTPDWNWDGLVQDARLGFMVGLAVADADTTPQWQPGDEFAHLRPPAGAAAAR
jgi:Zn-dependent M28 family amino/carboxypeptidase